jgi:zinc protease
MTVLLNIKSIIINSLLIFFVASISLGAMEYKYVRLDNGLQVYLFKNQDPIITHVIAYDVGSLEESSSKEGVAHYLEHVMFLGTNSYSKQKFFDFVKRTGAQINAYTSYDVTLYYFNLPKIYLEDVIKIEADRMQRLAFDETMVQNEIKAIIEERNMGENNAHRVFFELLNRYSFPTTNYGRSIIGYKEPFEKVSIKDLKSFYEKWYTPSNSKVFIIGDIDIKATLDMVKKHYGGLSNSFSDAPQRAKTQEEKYKSSLSFDYKHRQFEQEMVVKSYLVPSLISDYSLNKQRAKTILLLAKLLDSRSNGLYKDLVVNKKVAVDVAVSYNFSQKGDTTLKILAYPKEGISTEKLLEEIDKSLNKLANKGYSLRELDGAKLQILREFEYLKEDSVSYIFSIAHEITSGVSFEEAYNFPYIFNDIDIKEINIELKELLKQKSITARALKE